VAEPDSGYGLVLRSGNLLAGLHLLFLLPGISSFVKYIGLIYIPLDVVPIYQSWKNIFGTSQIQM
jgi:hypothetical protein